MRVWNRIRHHVVITALVASASSVLSPASFGQTSETALAVLKPAEARAWFEQHCFDCHSGDANEGNLQLDRLLEAPHNDSTHQAWWKVLANLRAGTMPPPDAGERPSETQVRALASWIKRDAMGINPDQPDPGRVTLRRLNRREYANTIRDLLGIDFNAEIVFPPDDTGYGFDNVGDALSLSPMLVEKYLSAASQIIHEAVPKANLEVPQQRIRASDIRGDDGRNAGNMRLNQSYKVGCTFEISTPGVYELEIVLRSGGSFEFSPQRCSLSCRLDDMPLFEGEYGWDEAKRDTRQFTRTWEPGRHRVEFVLTPIELKEPADDGSFADLDVERVTVRGPEGREHWTHPQGYHRFFTRDAAPEDPSERRAYAREVLQRFGERAFRRPVADHSLDNLVSIAETHQSETQSTFEASIAHAMIPMLASPRFLFRMEEPVHSSSDPYPLIDEWSLASRLSYFLWSTMPDDALFDLARNGQLRAQLRPTVERMLADPRSSAMLRNFVGQWLRTRDVEKTSIDPLAVYGLQPEFQELLAFIRRTRGQRPSKDAPETKDPESEQRRKRFQELRAIQDMWNADVRSAMRRETEMLFESIAKENRDLAELIDPGYTFLNERLAKHYGIEGVKGPDMRRVELPPESVRGGILTQGTLLTVTSNPTRTSPVKRGLYILENLLGTPTPPAPPNVPALEDSTSKFQGREPTLKELLAAHRESALCSSCHSRMDPLGIALENFDALGVWRETEKNQPIDASGKLITGEPFQDFRDLRKRIAVDHREDFYRCVTQKMFVYALGRGVEYHDEHAIDLVVDQLLQQNGKFQEMIFGIIESAPFQRQRKTAGDLAGS